MVKSTLWSYSAGEKPKTVTVYERKAGGALHARVWNPATKRFARVALGHKDRKMAQRYARDEAAKLERGELGGPTAKISLASVFALYAEHRVPQKTPRHQQQDLRRVEMWARWLGGTMDPHAITLAQWEGFIRARSSGAIDARAKRMSEDKRKPVRTRPVEIDCIWLNSVFNWAAKWRVDGRYLMQENPARGFEIPREKNPKRPLATQDRLAKLRAKSDEHLMEVRWDGVTRPTQRSYISELLDIVSGTGRRISAVCALRFDDLRLERTPTTPYGALRFRANSDKMGLERIVPMSPDVRAAVDRILRERPTIGTTPLFPSPTDRSKAMTRQLADRWLIELEKSAGVKPLEGGRWHPFRRAWATRRKHMSLKDVAAAGGWANPQTLLKCYMQVDDETVLDVVLNGEPVRVAK